jgi:hypothetical protein
MSDSQEDCLYELDYTQEDLFSLAHLIALNNDPKAIAEMSRRMAAMELGQ